MTNKQLFRHLQDRWQRSTDAGEQNAIMLELNQLAPYVGVH